MLVMMMIAVAVQAGPEQTREVSARYLKLDMARDLDALAQLYAPDATFLDPTGDVFEGPVSQGVVKSAKAIIAMQKSWGIGEMSFDVDTSFVVGEYALYRGTLSVQYTGAEARYAIPFITIHRVVENLVTERMDFGEYIESLGLGDEFDANTASTRKVGNLALRAYLNGDIETQTAFADEDTQIHDPTSNIFGPPVVQLLQGSEKLKRHRWERWIYKKAWVFNLEVERSFVANHHAVFMGNTTYTTLVSEEPLNALYGTRAAEGSKPFLI
jgi:ketosteroid isomerase-like protein